MRDRLIGAAVLVLLSVTVWVVWPSDRGDLECVVPPVPMDLVRDPSTLALEVRSTDRVTFDDERVVVRRVSFDSWRVQRCQRVKGRVDAYFVMPASADGTSTGRLAGVVRFSGTSLDETRAAAIRLTADTNVATIAPLLGPTAPHDHRLVDGLRALTALASDRAIDPTKLAVTGEGPGARAAWEGASLDDRVKVVVVRLSIGGWGGWRPEPLDAAALIVASSTTAYVQGAAWWFVTPTVTMRGGEAAVADTVGWWLRDRLFFGAKPALASPVARRLDDGRLKVIVDRSEPVRAVRVLEVRSGSMTERDLRAQPDGWISNVVPDVGTTVLFESVHHVGSRWVTRTSSPASSSQ